MVLALALVVGNVDVSVTVPRTVISRAWRMGPNPPIAEIRAHAAQVAKRLLEENHARAGEAWSIVIDDCGGATVFPR